MKQYCAVAMLLALTAGCGAPRTANPTPKTGGSNADVTPGSFTLRCPAFGDGGSIPVKFTADGEDVSPPLVWFNPPEGTVSLALSCDDPEAEGGTLVHWVIYNIPVEVPGLPEGVARVESLANGMRQGLNGFGTFGYRGPAPPRGQMHHYVFRLYAYDRMLELPPRASLRDLRVAGVGHQLAMTAMAGTYERR